MKTLDCLQTFFNVLAGISEPELPLSIFREPAAWGDRARSASTARRLAPQVTPSIVSAWARICPRAIYEGAVQDAILVNGR